MNRTPISIRKVELDSLFGGRMHGSMIQRPEHWAHKIGDRISVLNQDVDRKSEVLASVDDAVQSMSGDEPRRVSTSVYRRWLMTLPGYTAPKLDVLYWRYDQPLTPWDASRVNHALAVAVCSTISGLHLAYLGSIGANAASEAVELLRYHQDVFQAIANPGIKRGSAHG